MRKDYDEYQKFIYYKYGCYSFVIMTALMMLNFISDLRWAETRELEMILLLFGVVCYFVVMQVYHGAYFSRFENPILYNALFLVSGTIYVLQLFSPYREFIVNGQLTYDVISFASGLVWLLIPITYFIRKLVDRKQSKEDN